LDIYTYYDIIVMEIDIKLLIPNLRKKFEIT